MSQIRNTAFFTTFLRKINNNQVSSSGVVLNKNKDKIKEGGKTIHRTLGYLDGVRLDLP
jgi:hypothetical protein